MAKVDWKNSEIFSDIKKPSVGIYKDYILNKAVIGNGITKSGFYNEKVVANSETIIRLGIECLDDQKIISAILVIESNKVLYNLDFFANEGSIPINFFTIETNVGKYISTINYVSAGTTTLFLQAGDIEAEIIGLSVKTETNENLQTSNLADYHNYIYNSAVLGNGLLKTGFYNEKAVVDFETIVRFGIKSRPDNKIKSALLAIKANKSIDSASFFDNAGNVVATETEMKDGKYIYIIDYDSEAGTTELFVQISDIELELLNVKIITTLNIAEQTVLKTTTEFEKLIKTTTLIVKYSGTEGVDCDFVGRRGIQAAIDSITNATEYNRYIIKVFPGRYSAVNVEQFDKSFEFGYAFILMKNYVDIQGVSKDEVFVVGFLPTNLGVDFPYSLYNVVVFHANATIDGITIVGESLRYPLHIDDPSALIDSQQCIKKCRLVYAGKYGDSTNWTGWTALGCGTASGQQILIEDTEIKSPRVGVGFHSNTNFSKASEMIFRRCMVLTTTNDATGSIVTSVSLGSMVKDRLVFDNCVLDSGYITISDTPWINTALEAQVADHAQMEIIFTGMKPRAVDGSELRGFGLKIKSKSVGNGSTVRFDKDSTAFPIVIGNPDDFITVDNRYLRREVYGYQFKDGGNGLSGYAIGGKDIGMYKVGFNTDYIGALGKRLGDCTAINKTLTVIIDGTSYDVVFNKNYNGTASTVLPNYTNAQIIAEIVAVIGAVATVEEYVVGRDYYPQFDGVVNMINADTQEVYNGMGIVFTGLKTFRRAVNSDNKIDGIVLDDGRVGDNCRIITDGEIFEWYSSQRFRIKEETWAALSFGDKLGISAGNAGYFVKDATPALAECIGNGIVRIIR